VSQASARQSCDLNVESPRSLGSLFRDSCRWRCAPHAQPAPKSGGEWISSLDVENALVAHPAVAEAAVIAVPHPNWQERPLAIMVLKDGAEANAEELRFFLASQFAKWQLPDDFVFFPELPHTSTGKLLKSELRQTYKDWNWDTLATAD
jgi:acyl-CoA synthetase (AMP-forming)/AMP-acid ligase II